MNWYAIYTKPRAEESTTRLLSNAGIETLNPKIKIRKYLRKRYAEVIEQLFPCYIFAFLDYENHAHMVSYTRGVRYIVGRERPIVIPTELIEDLRERMEGDVVIPQHEDFEPGDRVQIKEGPFRDFYGIFERTSSGRERVMILLDMLHVKLEVEKQSIGKA
jgi:transcriptional antiterminator RfaH